MPFKKQNINKKCLKKEKHSRLQNCSSTLSEVHLTSGLYYLLGVKILEVFNHVTWMYLPQLFLKTSDLQITKTNEQLWLRVCHTLLDV